jgi:ATP-dependent Clp protease ATP-binding subunit ClpC
VVVDVDGDGLDAHFTFAGNKKTELPDLPPIETASTAEND